MALEEKLMHALGGEREAQMDDTCRGQAPCKQAELMVTNLTGPKPNSATLVKNRIVLGEAKLDRKEDF